MAIHPEKDAGEDDVGSFMSLHQESKNRLNIYKLFG